jgi:hypothetical protein
MAEIVNLRSRRKRLARDAADEGAARNRARHGRTRAEREADAAAEATRALGERRLAGHKLAAVDRDDPEG